MKILIVSEGRHELGDGRSPGALEILLHKLAGHFTCEQRKVSDSHELRRFKGKGRGYFKRAIAWMRYAERSGFDGIVLVVDQDDDPQRSSDMKDAQAYSAFTFPRAFGVAIRTFDAWMLADEKALGKILGKKVQRQSDPEEVANPKKKCDDLRSRHSVDLGLGEMYAAIARTADLEVLADRCPKGFAPFATRVRQLRAVS